MYVVAVDVGVTELRANLADWLQKVRAGESLTITERGLPIARLTPIGESELLARLEREGVIERPQSPKRDLPYPTLSAGISASDIIIEFRDEKR
jgi:prevent-host-death family protein